MWVIRLAAAVGVVVAGGAFGAQRAGRLGRQRQALQDVLLLLRRLRVRMETGVGLWLEEIAAVAADGGFQVLCFQQQTPQQMSRRLLQYGAPEQVLEEFLAAADEEHLLGDAVPLVKNALLCAVTRTETLSRLDYYCQLLSQKLEAARQRELRDKKMYLQMGWLGGALLAVILW